MLENNQQTTTQELREDIYDERISPLVHQIIQLCQENKISMVAAFHTPNSKASDITCTTGILNPAWGAPDTFIGALKLLKDGYLAFAVAKDDNGNQVPIVMPMDDEV